MPKYEFYCDCGQTRIETLPLIEIIDLGEIPAPECEDCKKPMKQKYECNFQIEGIFNRRSSGYCSNMPDLVNHYKRQGKIGME